MIKSLRPNTLMPRGRKGVSDDIVLGEQGRLSNVNKYFVKKENVQDDSDENENMSEIELEE